MPAIGLSTKFRASFLDHSGERTSTQLHLDPLDSSGDNSTVIGLISTGGSLAVALTAMSRLPLAGITASVPLVTASPGLPVDAMAQREIAIRFTYSDDVTAKKHHFDLPAPVDAIIPTGSDNVNRAAALIVAFKAVFDVSARSELGNDVTLLTGRFVGRRS